MDISKRVLDTAWLPVSAVCQMLLVSRQRVYQLVAEGKLTAMKVNSTWMVLRRSVEARLALLEAESEDRDGYR